MCGIVGIVGRGQVATKILEGLKRLEYRGYDSAGIAVVNNNEISKVRAEGKLENLERLLASRPLEGSVGIGHTRWATHGAPTVNNAHPHSTPLVAVAHNGIIENYRELKESLQSQGYEFSSETDSEVIAIQIHHYLQNGAEPVSAVRQTLKLLHGAYALAIIFKGNDNLLIGARQGSPLAVGYGEGTHFLGSDSIAIAPFTPRISYLEDGDMALLTSASVEIFDKNNHLAMREVKVSSLTGAAVGKGGFRHYMLKEIFEQPTVIGESLNTFVNHASGLVALPDNALFLAEAKAISIVACGTSYYAGLVAAYWFEKLCGIPCRAEIASEYRYRADSCDHALMLFISQSGETADTLAVLRLSTERGRGTIALVNSAESSMAREADLALRIYAGVEIGVASTKAFTAQLAALACLAIHIGVLKGRITEEQNRRLLHGLWEVPAQLAEILTHEAAIQKIALKLAQARDVLYLGRGVCFPIALEGALKLKEISYIHAEGFAAGELKHGPIALVDENVPVIAIAPSDELFSKTASNIQEVKARGGRIILISDKKGIEELSGLSEAVIEMPQGDFLTVPIMYSLPVQLLAYHAAVAKGTDVDQPRNLAKSVTVE